jgi:Ca2+-transporting ATPase
VPDAVRQCQLAGIKVRMITGDNVLTARSIAAEIGILTDGAAIEGPDFRKMSPEEQREILKTMQVMARCSPQDKLTMVRRLKEMGEVLSVLIFVVSFAP